MTVPNEPVALIIDALPLRSLAFISTLNRLNRLGDATKVPATLHTHDEAGPWIDAHANCEMLIYIADGECNADCDNLERIKALRALAPDVPLMILSDSESREDIISILDSGAQGYLYVGIGEPSSRISPTLEIASPTIKRHSVLLPAPEGPIIARTSPGSTSQETWLRMS